MGVPLKFVEALSVSADISCVHLVGAERGLEGGYYTHVKRRSAKSGAALGPACERMCHPEISVVDALTRWGRATTR